jgi:hypothetical protein|nr:MAG TPA: hypothetical protein [Caudoviricetes sp.]
MAVTHVLKNGTILQDITGHIVKVNDARSIYQLISKLNERKEVKKCLKN